METGKHSYIHCESLPVGRWDVFISYARTDAVDATHIAERFRAHRLRVWLDRNEIESRYEPLFSAVLSEGLVEAGILVVVCSPHAVKSAWVEKELQLFILTSKGDATPARIRLVALNDYATKHFDVQARAFGDALKSNVDIGVLAPEDIDQFAVALSNELAVHVGSAEEFAEYLDLSTAISTGRIRAAEEYWARNNIMARAGWGNPDFEELLTRFDNLGPFYDLWWHQNGELFEPRIKAVLDTIMSGKRHVKIANTAGQQTVMQLRGYEELNGIVHCGSPLEVLVSMTVEANILSDLQATYYLVRYNNSHRSRTRDVLDLTAVLATGFCIDRWQQVRPSMPRVIDALLAQRRLS